MDFLVKLKIRVVEVEGFGEWSGVEKKVELTLILPGREVEQHGGGAETS